MSRSFLLVLLLLFTPGASVRPLPELIQHEIIGSNNGSSPRRDLGYLTSETGNTMDDCWLSSGENWQSLENRQNYAFCAQGFGKNALGGFGGKYYWVTDNSDSATNPKTGTLRHAVIQPDKLWILFEHDMEIVLEQELMISSYTTIDARDRKVSLTGNSGLTVQFANNVIITGLEIYNMASAGNAFVRDSPTHSGYRTQSDGDGIGLFTAKNVWIDHCELYHCTDGLVDVIQGSTNVTISNSFFHDHNEAILLGAHDNYADDVNMKITVAYNWFGDNITQRTPRIRFGFAHVLNNYWPCGWNMYAVGGSDGSTILAEGNIFVAPDSSWLKEVTHRQDTSPVNFISKHNEFDNYAYFVESGSLPETYQRASLLSATNAVNVRAVTAQAGTLWSNHKGHTEETCGQY
ncbi:pectin lyase-like superfamily protein [Striga asiatica]|uniref:Pectate lyase n=1 Tax=Striga asiatica TaxID=4170 RepID=A0A5A7R350_STRAF|nr:pectin lyase-like superfamily protein [Striga asiatica]